jgi:hypothetical protein
MLTPEITRRKFIGALASLQSVLGVRARGNLTAQNLKGLLIDNLHLPQEVLVELEQLAEPVIAEARRLEELNFEDLPLEAVNPGFTFVAQ